MKNTVCYALICLSPRTGRTYPRYFKTISGETLLTLKEIQERIEPYAVQMFVSKNRRQAIEIMKSHLIVHDDQPGLFPEGPPGNFTAAFVGKQDKEEFMTPFAATPKTSEAAHE